MGCDILCKVYYAPCIYLWTVALKRSSAEQKGAREDFNQKVKKQKEKKKNGSSFNETTS